METDILYVFDILIAGKLKWKKEQIRKKEFSNLFSEGEKWQKQMMCTGVFTKI